MAPAQVISVKDLPPEVLGEAAPPVGGGNGGVPAPAALPHAPAPLAEEGLGRLAVPVSALAPPHDTADRKSTRLNSSHLVISYAVFCLKKKKPRYISTRLRLHAIHVLPLAPFPDEFHIPQNVPSDSTGSRPPAQCHAGLPRIALHQRRRA